MADQVAFNKVIYINRIKRAGITDDQARAHAEAIEEALRGSVATKADIDLVRNDLQRLEHQIERGARDMIIHIANMMAVLLIVLVAIKFVG